MTADPFLIYFPLLFPLIFAAVWIGVTTLLGFLSGWLALMEQYPDRDEKPLLQLNWESGMMGAIGVNMRNILKIGVCPSDLCIGMLRVFGLFCCDFFVPWRDISVEKRRWFLWPMTELRFGQPGVGRLLIYAKTAERLATASRGWPEIGNALKESKL